MASLCIQPKGLYQLLKKLIHRWLTVFRLLHRVFYNQWHRSVTTVKDTILENRKLYFQPLNYDIVSMRASLRRGIRGCRKCANHRTQKIFSKHISPVSGWYFELASEVERRCDLRFCITRLDRIFRESLNAFISTNCQFISPLLCSILAIL